MTSLNKDIYNSLFVSGVVDDLSAKLTQTKASNVFHYGCGDGALYGELLSRGHKFSHFTGADFRKDKIDTAKTSYTDAEFLVQNQTTAYGSNSPFDFVIAFQTLEYLNNPGTLLQKLVNICSGTLYLVVSTGSWYQSLNFLRSSDQLGFTAGGRKLQNWKLKSFVNFVEGYRIVSDFYSRFPYAIVTVWCED